MIGSTQTAAVYLRNSYAPDSWKSAARYNGKYNSVTLTQTGVNVHCEERIFYQRIQTKKLFLFLLWSPDEVPQIIGIGLLPDTSSWSWLQTWFCASGGAMESISKSSLEGGNKIISCFKIFRLLKLSNLNWHTSGCIFCTVTWQLPVPS